MLKVYGSSLSPFVRKVLLTLEFKDLSYEQILVAPGMFPPNILKYDASSVPILQLGLSSKSLREQEIFDLGNNFIRPPLGTVQGASVSYPFGGKLRQIMVNLNQGLLQSKGLSPSDVLTALGNQNLILPGGTAKVGQFEYDVDLNEAVQPDTEGTRLWRRQQGRRLDTAHSASIHDADRR